MKYWLTVNSEMTSNSRSLTEIRSNFVFFVASRDNAIDVESSTFYG